LREKAQFAKTRLARLLRDAAEGRFPPADGLVTVFPQPSARDAGVLGFTAHAVVFADVEPDWVSNQLPPGDLGAPLGPPFLQALSAATNRRPGSIDMVCVADPQTGPPPLDLTPDSDPEHPRVARALNYRDDVRAWQADGGVVLLGRGVAGRWETAIEVDENRRERGLGRALARAARHLVPDGERLWAQVAPANAASVRAFVAAGFVPVGAEILLARRPASAQTRSEPCGSSCAPARCDDSGMNEDERVIDNRAESRFELTVEGAVAELRYRRRADRLVLLHTEVPDRVGGHGIGGLLVKAAVERASGEGLTVVPLCPFARSWLERHPDVAENVNVDWGEPPED
jgi:predicted GNAT family acetyltransferase